MADKPRVLVGRKLPDAIEARLSTDYEPELNPQDTLYSPKELIKRSHGMDAILACHTEKFSSETIFGLADSVKIIANFSVGYDHVNTDAAVARGLIVTNTPDVLSDATAEITMLCMLGAARRAGEGEAMMRSNTWKDWSPAFMVGLQVTGKKLGIIGMGRVGQTFAKRAARGFDMEVHYFNRSRLSPEDENGAIYHQSIESLLPEAEILSLHCPSTPETKGLLNASRIALLPRGAVVVNTARGGLIDDDALVTALQSGHVRAAGLDVYNGEPTAIHPAYRELQNTFLLPHIGSATEETREAMGHRALDNLDAFFNGGVPKDRVA